MSSGPPPGASDFRINWVWMQPWGPDKITDDGRGPSPEEVAVDVRRRNSGVVPLEPRLLIERLSRDIDGVLRDDLRGLYVHGSWVLGDFDPRRSDVDLLAVLAADPTPGIVEALRALHEQLAADHPDWADRVEVEYLSAIALTSFRTDPHPMVRLSPGEPLHLVPATRHYLLNWSAARERGVVLRGPRPQDLIPEISVAEWADVVREHARQWPDWLSEMRAPGQQASAVLTLCRALFSIEQGCQVSSARPRPGLPQPCPTGPIWSSGRAVLVRGAVRMPSRAGCRR